VKGRVLAVSGVVVGTLAAAVTAARAIPLDDDRWQMALSFSAYALVGYGLAGLALIGASLRRRTAVRLSAVALVVALAAVHASWIVPRYVRDDRPASTGSISLLTANLWVGRADPESLAKAAEPDDLVVLTEVTQPALDRLDALGWSSIYPYRTPGPLPSGGTAGTMVLSRWPLSDTTKFAPEIAHQAWATTVAIPEIGDVIVVGVHPRRPFFGKDDWAPEQRRLRASLLDLKRSTSKPIIVAGDFNSVDDHPTMRNLRTDGFVSATDIAGAGWLPTYRATGSIPPLVGIDHILLTPGLTATSTETVHVAHTDHCGLRATIAGSPR
jgi:endonuclease/exonuclease/phosphatase (EEP) superfamily protein YafD